MIYKFEADTASPTIAFTGTEREIFHHESRSDRTRARWARIIAESDAIGFYRSDGEYITVTPNTHADSPKRYQITWHDEHGAIMDEKHDTPEEVAKVCYRYTWNHGAEVETIQA